MSHKTASVVDFKSRSSEPEAPKATWTGTFFQGMLRYRRTLLLHKQAELEGRPRAAQQLKAFKKITGDALRHELGVVKEQLVRVGAVRICPCVQTRSWKEELQVDHKCPCGGSGLVPCSEAAVPQLIEKEVNS